MFDGRFVFAQVTEFVPWYEFDKFVAKYNGNYRAHGFNCKDQSLHLLFGQLTAYSSLRDICLCLIAHENCVYHLGFRKRLIRQPYPEQMKGVTTAFGKISFTIS